MKNFIADGTTLDFPAPAGGCVSGVGLQVGAAIFGVAKNDAAQNETVVLQMHGVVEIAKTSALAISAGDLLYWDAANKCVNKTSSAQLQVGKAVAAAANPSPTVRMLLTAGGLVGA